MTTLAEKNVINARLKGRLKARGDMKRQEGLFEAGAVAPDTPQILHGEMTGERAYELMKHMAYLGPVLPMQSMIESAYPDHELFFELLDGTAFAVGTADGCMVIDYGNSLLEVLNEVAPGVGVADIIENKAEVSVPGMKNVYYMEC